METFTSRRSPVLSTGGMVATSQPLAVAAGLEILSRGGNAADAAVAAAAALNVTEPTSTGIGGDAFALYFPAGEGRVHALNGSGRSPRALSIERLKEEALLTPDGRKIADPFHAHTVTVPGACAAWCELVERHGRLQLVETLAPAIRLAEMGFPVAPVTAYSWARGTKRQLSRAANGQELTIDGRAPRAGEIFRNPGLARTLRAVALGGRKAFYEGEIAEAIVSVLRESGGAMSALDLAECRAEWQTPLSVRYRDHLVWECPPNGQGLAALLALNILGGLPIGELGPLSVERLHLMIESMRLAFADAAWYVADPDFFDIPLSELLSEGYTAARRGLIDPKKATLDQRFGSPVSAADTVYLSVVDGEGNACSFINSNYMGFGTGIVPAGWGFTLQNRGHNFRTDPGHPNALAPGKRPYHTIIPAMLTGLPDASGRLPLAATFGVMGGFMQPQGHLQVVVGLLEDGLDPQAALDRPRFCIEQGEAGGGLSLEEGIPGGVISRLARMGHRVVVRSGYERSIFGRGQVIARDPDSGVLWGGSDPRADGCALGLVPPT